MEETKLSKKQIDDIRLNLKHGDNVTQTELNELHATLGISRSFNGSDNEIFSIVNSQGAATNLTATRWLCHLLGLRHRSIHVILQWQSPRMGNVFIFQIRSWQKIDFPGCIDISVGGHVTMNDKTISVIDSAYRELSEELGLDKNNLTDKQLVFRAGYESYDEDKGKNFHNAEWRDVYLGRLNTNEFDKLKFVDKEVVGLYLCPETEAEGLLSQTLIPVASALKLSLPYCLHL